METNKIRRVPVVDDKGGVVGIVSLADVVRNLIYRGTVAVCNTGYRLKRSPSSVRRWRPSIDCAPKLVLLARNASTCAWPSAAGITRYVTP